MARTFRTKRQTHPIAELNVTNLIDLGFMLLIIFMLTTSASKQEQTIPVNLPLESRSPQQQKSDANKYVVVTVRPDGFYVDSDPAALTVRQLREKLQGYTPNAKRTVIRIRGDTTTQWGRMVQVLDELKKANLLQLTIDSQTEN
jgi:biopolymer transport protein ExbD